MLLPLQDTADMIFMSEIKAGITVCIVSLFSICLR